MKHKLVFDTTDAQSISDSDSVGAYLRSASGTLITHTTVGGKEALDVRVAEGINVEVDLNAADDSVESWTNDGAGNPIGSTGGALHISDAGGSLTVDAIDLDIRDLDAAQDNIQAWAHDGVGTAITSTVIASDTGLDVNVINNLTVSDAALANTAIISASKTLAVANTSENIITSPLANRKYLWVLNYSNKEIYIGASGVTSANGFPLSPAFALEMRAGAAVDIEYVGRTGQLPEIRTLELS